MFCSIRRWAGYFCCAPRCTSPVKYICSSLFVAVFSMWHGTATWPRQHLWCSSWLCGDGLFYQSGDWTLHWTSELYALSWWLQHVHPYDSQRARVQCLLQRLETTKRSLIYNKYKLISLKGYHFCMWVKLKRNMIKIEVEVDANVIDIGERLQQCCIRANNRDINVTWNSFIK